MTCSVDGCENPHLARSLCRKHYYRLQRTGSTADPQRGRATCTFEGCTNPVHGQGLCAKHHQRKARHGDAAKTLRQRDEGPAETRWMAKVSVESPGCWMWTVGDDGQGYGPYEGTRIHRYVWELLVGPIPEGMELDHLCRRRRCCNPDHLQPVPHLINVRRGITGARIKNTEEKRAARAAYMRDYMARRRAAARQAAGT